MERKPQIDNYIAGDIYKSDGTYDFISAFLCLEHFDLGALFPKVSSMLSHGGVFCFLTSSWWWPVNSTTIVGDFPYACQRLIRDDLKRYFEETHPDETEDVLRRWDSFNHGLQRPIRRYNLPRSQAEGAQRNRCKQCEMAHISDPRHGANGLSFRQVWGISKNSKLRYLQS